MPTQAADSIDHAARVRELQNAKARECRLESLGKRDPLIRQLLVAHRQQAADLATAKASLASAALELDRVKTQAANDAAEAKTGAEVAASLRKELAEALKKAKPAGGQ